jgi:UV DNA damage endonuclease
MRFGFVVKPLGRPDLRSHDSRRWQNEPHLSVSLAYVRDIFSYLTASGITMYRLSSSLAPYATHSGLPQFAGQLVECRDELAHLGEIARAACLRLSIHVGQYTSLSATEPEIIARSIAELTLQARLLDAMGLGPEAVVVTHLGGVYGDPVTARDRFIRCFHALPPHVQARLALENDDSRGSVSDALDIHRRTGIRLVFDYLHHRLLNPDRLSVRHALTECLASWPAEQEPKIHFSSPRTEWLAEEPADPTAPPRLRKTRWSRHSDYVNPFEFVDFLRAAEGLRPFDVMLEARARDLALLQLRRDVTDFAPDLADRCTPTTLPPQVGQPSEVLL